MFSPTANQKKALIKVSKISWSKLVRRGIFLELPVDTLRPIQDEKLQFERLKTFTQSMIMIF